MKIIKLLLAGLCLFTLSYEAQAQRIWRATVDPSDEREAAGNEVTRGWLCYDGRTGRLIDTCSVAFNLSTTIGGPGVLNTCIIDSSGAAEPLTCGNGGHTHIESDRPVIFNNSEVRYFGDTDTAPLVVAGKSPTSIFLAGFTWQVPQVGGYYTFDSSMTAPDRFFFVSFSNGILFLDRTIESIGLVNVTHRGDSLRQLPDLPSVYLKERRGFDRQVGSDDAHFDNIAYAATAGTLLVLPLIAIEYTAITMGDIISYNDSSLPKGGVFDLTAFDQNTNNPKRWKEPHESHRMGQDTDVNRPGGPGSPGCDVNKNVKFAVDRILAFNTAQNRPAMYCENTGNFHIDTTSLRIAGKPIEL